MDIKPSKKEGQKSSLPILSLVVDAYTATVLPAA